MKAGGEEIRLINGLKECPQGPSEPNTGLLTPVLVDFDGDGDLDLIVGDMRGFQTYFENVGTAQRPELGAGKVMEVNGERRCFGWRNEVAAGDLYGDGKIQVITTAFGDRRISAYQPASIQDDPEVLRMSKTATLKLESGEDLAPAVTDANNNGDFKLKLVDWDNDGDLDLFIGSLYNVWYYENIGTKTSPKFRYRGKVQAEGKDLHVSNHAGSVEVVDLNGDGKKDIIINGESGWLYYFDRSFLDGVIPRISIKTVETRR
jgi:hypothetical protein